MAGATAPTLQDTSPTPAERERYHSLDFLRGSLMLLGIVFHAALPYDDLSPWIKDAPLSSPLGFVALSIHAFRMPIFFVMTGFFAALLLTRRGPVNFVVNRGLRIGLPLLVGWLVLVPLVFAGSVFAISANFTSLSSAFDRAWELLKGGDFLFEDSSMHLWFLYYLLMFYGVLLVTRAIAGRVHTTRQERLSRGFGRLLESAWRLPVLTVLVFGLLQLVDFPNYESPESFTPDPRLFVYYGAFFAFGFLLFNHRGVLTGFGAGAWLCIALAGAASVALRVSVDEWSTAGANTSAWSAVGRAATALSICGMLFGSIGLLQRYLDRPLPPMRYVADASYWWYLIHLPLVVWLPGVLVKVDWPPELKFAVVVAVASVVCLVTYELFVRWTYLGTLLQGRRYPSLLRLARRKAPATVPASATPA